jgi:hypothetical protein
LIGHTVFGLVSTAFLAFILHDCFDVKKSYGIKHWRLPDVRFVSMQSRDRVAAVILTRARLEDECRDADTDWQSVKPLTSVAYAWSTALGSPLCISTLSMRYCSVCVRMSERRILRHQSQLKLFFSRCEHVHLMYKFIGMPHFETYGIRATNHLGSKGDLLFVRGGGG